MNKKIKANIKVKEKISNALFSLMKEKKFENIKVTEIVERAKVARSSYYKNFNSKEEIIYDLAYRLNELLIETIPHHMKNNTFDFQNLNFLVTTHGFEFYLQHKEEFLILANNNLIHIYINFLNDLIEEVSGDMPASSIEKYNLYCYTGALFNLILKWMENGAKESPEEIAKIFMKFVSK